MTGLLMSNFPLSIFFQKKNLKKFAKPNTYPKADDDDVIFIKW